MPLIRDNWPRSGTLIVISIVEGKVFCFARAGQIKWHIVARDDNHALQFAEGNNFNLNCREWTWLYRLKRYLQFHFLIPAFRAYAVCTVHLIAIPRSYKLDSDENRGNF